MPITYSELQSLLDIDEPDYVALAVSAAGAMVHLRKMAASSDEALASKAVSLAAMIGGDKSLGVVGDAAKSGSTLVRLAAAHASQFLPDHKDSVGVIHQLLGDKDLGVVKLASRAISSQSNQPTRTVTKAKAAVTRLKSEASTSKRAASKNNLKMNGAAMSKGQKASNPKATKSSAKASSSSGVAVQGMPVGAMAEPPKGSKLGDMPKGSMT
jgi:hypothetical protein